MNKHRILTLQTNDAVVKERRFTCEFGDGDGRPNNRGERHAVRQHAYGHPKQAAPVHKRQREACHLLQAALEAARPAHLCVAPSPGVDYHSLT